MKRSIIILIFISIFVFSCFSSNNTNSQKLKVIIANLFYSNKEPADAAKSIVDYDADVIILVEYTGVNIDLNMLKDNNYKIIIEERYKNPKGIAIAVKNNIQATGSIITPPVRGGCEMPFAVATFKYNNKDISVLGVHVPPPIGGCKKLTKPTIKAIREWIKDGKLDTNLGTGKKGDYLILGGDFNSFSFDKEMKKMKKHGMIDSHTKSKSLYEPTWGSTDSDDKFARIDYVFASKHFKVLSSEAFIIPGSDHKGVYAEIEIK